MAAPTKCMKCGKPATTKITKIVKGKVIDIFLCDEHARDFTPYLHKDPEPANLIEILQQFLKHQSGEAGEETEEAGPKCPRCGLEFSAYRKTLLLGCSECYSAFEQMILNDLRKMHGAVSHGAPPAGAPKQETPETEAPETEAPETPPVPVHDLAAEIDFAAAAGDFHPLEFEEAQQEDFPTLPEMEQRMQEAIEAEDFSGAARLRDAIAAMQQAQSNEDVICPQCGALMVVRHGPHGPFLGCSSFPQCRCTRRIGDVPPPPTTDEPEES